ncbi:MAG: O-antigen ligase family protein, partial [Acidobacteriota bacterium]
TCAAAWLLWAAKRALEGKEAFEQRLWRLAPPVIAFSLLFVGIAFSGSRAGLLAAVGALTCQGAVVAIRHRRWQMIALAAAPMILGLGGLAALGWQRGLARWLETSIYDVTWNARIFAWKSSFELWWSTPVTGTGLGTFRQAFPLVQPDNLSGTWHHAHSDVLELLVTTGLLGWVLLPLALLGLYRRLWKVYRRGRRSEDRAGGLAVLGSATAALLHSFVDFGLTIPANAFALAIMVGLACGTLTLESRTRKTTGLTVFMDRRSDATPLGEVSEKASRGRGSRR